MSVDDVFTALGERDAVLYVEDGRLRYVGPKLGSDDVLLDAIDAHRVILTEWFTFTPHVLGAAQDVDGIPDPCVILGCSEPIADGDIVYCSRHRVMADDGTLWLRCVNHPARPVAPNDPIACPECRALIGATVMPWEVPA